MNTEPLSKNRLFTQKPKRLFGAQAAKTTRSQKC